MFDAGHGSEQEPFKASDPPSGRLLDSGPGGPETRVVAGHFYRGRYSGK